MVRFRPFRALLAAVLLGRGGAFHAGSQGAGLVRPTARSSRVVVRAEESEEQGKRPREREVHEDFLEPELNLPAVPLKDLSFDRPLGEVFFTKESAATGGQRSICLGGLARAKVPDEASLRVFQAARKNSAPGSDPRVLLREFGPLGYRSESGDIEASGMAMREMRTLCAMEAHYQRLVEAERTEDSEAGAGGKARAEGAKKSGTGAASASSGSGGEPKLPSMLVSLWDNLRSGDTGEDQLVSEHPRRFSTPLGDLTKSLEESIRTGHFNEEEWTKANKGIKIPRKDSLWVVLAYDGESTLTTFCRPTAERVRNPEATFSLGGSPRHSPASSPMVVTRQQVADFLVKGVIPQCLEAVEFLHECGFAHRSLSADSFILSAKSVNKNEACERCDKDLLQVKLQNLMFSARLGEESRVQLAAAKDLGMTVMVGDSYEMVRRKIKNGHRAAVQFPKVDTLALASLSIAYDLFALGFVFLSTLLGALAEPENGAMPPPVDSEYLERIYVKVYKSKFQNFKTWVYNEPAWATTAKILEGNDNAGWDFFEALLTAREAAVKRSEAGEISILSAGGVRLHPFVNDLELEL